MSKIVTCGGCHQGQRNRGVEFGFTAFMAPLKELAKKDGDVVYNDFRNEVYFEDPIYGSLIMGNNIIECVGESKTPPDTLLTFGGDHTISFGTIYASKKIYGGVKVIWIDAHPDTNTPESSLSGNCHGMPVAFLLGLSKHYKVLTDDPIIDFSDIVYIGLRSIDPFEKNVLEKYDITYYTANNVKEKGIDGVLEEISEKWSDDLGKTKIHVSLDIDSIDPKFAPATGTPVKDGLTPKDVMAVLDYANDNSPHGANLDITEVNPLLSDVKGVCDTYDVCHSVLSRYISKLK